MANGHLLIAALFPGQVTEVDSSFSTVWSFGTGTSGCSAAQLSSPSDVLEIGTDRLIVDQGNNRLLQVNLAGSVVWEYGDPACLGGSAF
jgi:hypothetical protein